MSDQKVNVSTSGGIGLFLFLSAWLVFGRGCDNRPSSFEHWLNARYGYEAPDANWQERAAEANEAPVAAPGADLRDELPIDAESTENGGP